MKKIINLFLVLFLLIGTFGLVVADIDEVEIPESKRIGFFENSFDRIKLALTFNKEKKVEFALKMAEKRLAEAEALSDDDPETYAYVIERYDDIVARAEKILAAIKSNADDVDGSVDDVERLVRIQNMFERYREHADEIYVRALERFEINNASDEKIERFEMFYERALNRTNKMEERILEKKDNALKRHKVLGNVSDDELEATLDRIERREGLMADREARRERLEDRILRVIELRNRNIERARLRLDANVNLTEEQRLEIEKRIDNNVLRIGQFETRVFDRLDNVTILPAFRANDSNGSLRRTIRDELANR